MKQVRLAKCLVLAVLGIGCGAEPHMLAKLSVSAENKIIDGTPANGVHHGAVAALLVDLGSVSALCSGTVVDESLVLTAAHCVVDEDDALVAPEAIVVFFGETLDPPETPRAVSQVDMVPGYSSTAWDKDLAMLRLTEPQPANVEPIPFLPRNLALTGQDLGLAVEWVGFGRDENGATGRRLRTELTLDHLCSGIACNDNTGLELPSVPNILCSVNDPTGICSGDSGGPLFVTVDGQRYVAGASSFGDSECKVFGCAARTDLQDDFIIDFIEGRLPDSNNGGSAGGGCSGGGCLSGDDDAILPTRAPGGCQSADAAGAWPSLLTVVAGWLLRRRRTPRRNLAAGASRA